MLLIVIQTKTQTTYVEKVKAIVLNKKKCELKEMTAIYGKYEIDGDLTMCKIYNNSTLKIHVFLTKNLDFHY
jgi:hypothetical protein